MFIGLHSCVVYESHLYKNSNVLINYFTCNFLLLNSTYKAHQWKLKKKHFINVENFGWLISWANYYYKKTQLQLVQFIFDNDPEAVADWYVWAIGTAAHYEASIAHTNGQLDPQCT